jgi:hypothetical protein
MRAMILYSKFGLDGPTFGRRIYVDNCFIYGVFCLFLLRVFL